MSFFARYPGILPGSSGGEVTSLNGLTGDLTIVPGTYLTVTPSGSDITIATDATSAATPSTLVARDTNANSQFGALTMLNVSSGVNNVGLGGSASASALVPLYVHRSVNGSVMQALENANTSAGAGIALQLSTDGGNSLGWFEVFTTATVAPDAYAGGAVVIRTDQSTPNLSLVSGLTGGDIKFYTDGYASTNERMKVSSAGVNIPGLTASQAVVTDGSSNLTSYPYAVGDTGSTLVARDSQGNSVFNNSVSGSTATVSSGQTINLTSGSTRIQTVTGTSTVTFNLPDATSLTPTGWTYEIGNLSTGNVTINLHDGTTLLATAVTGAYAYAVCIDNTTTNGQWNIHWLVPAVNTWGTSGLGLSGTLGLEGSTSGTFTAQAAATTTSYTVTLPAAQGTGALTNNGSGVLSWASGGSGANTTLSNLTSPTAINQDLIPNADATFNLGTTGAAWNRVAFHYLEDSSGNLIVGAQAVLYDPTSHQDVLNWGGQALNDTSANISVDWNNRMLYANDGATKNLNWATAGQIGLFATAAILKFLASYTPAAVGAAGTFIGNISDNDQTNQEIYIGSTDTATANNFTSSLWIASGSQTTSSGTGGVGDVQISTGNIATGSSNAGSPVLVTTGTTDSGAAGNISCTPGTTASGVAGQIILTGGHVSSGSNNGGDVVITGGSAGGTGTGGNINLTPGAGAASGKISLFGHVDSRQSTAPTTTTNANAGTGASSSVAHATDTAGVLNLTLGSIGTLSSGVQVTVNFNQTYSVAPIVVITPTNATTATNVAAFGVYVSSAINGFSVNFGTAGVATDVLQWNYVVIETQ
jgi:hypothetical protein